MTNTQTLEILEVIKSLPSEKIDEVKDFAVFLRERYGKNEVVDESDEWTEKDLNDVSNSSNLPEKKTPAELLAKIAALPLEGKTDKFSNRDHDRILYGTANEK